jgi:hypothetical protein
MPWNRASLRRSVARIGIGDKQLRNKSKARGGALLEGATEMAVVPLIFDKIYAAKPNVFGIELVSLGGISNATGGRENSHSALGRLIDYLHHHQTIAFVLLDNEGLAPTNIGRGLPRQDGPNCW